MALPSLVVAMGFEHSCATGGSVAGGSTCWSTGVSSPVDVDEGVGLACTVAVGDGETATGRSAEEHAHAASTAATARVRRLAAAAELPLHRRRDLVSRKVIEPVIVRSHALG